MLDLTTEEIENVKICILLVAKSPQTDIGAMKYLVDLWDKIDSQAKVPGPDISS
jgi:hypothetical protein